MLNELIVAPQLDKPNFGKSKELESQAFKVSHIWLGVLVVLVRARNMFSF